MCASFRELCNILYVHRQFWIVQFLFPCRLNQGCKRQKFFELSQALKFLLDRSLLDEPDGKGHYERRIPDTPHILRIYWEQWAKFRSAIGGESYHPRLKFDCKKKSYYNRLWWGCSYPLVFLYSVYYIPFGILYTVYTREWEVALKVTSDISIFSQSLKNI